MWSTIAVSTLLASLLLALAAVAGKLRLGPIEDRWRLPPIRLRADDAARFGEVRSTRTPLVVTLDEGDDDALAGAGRIAASTWRKGQPPVELRLLVATARPRGIGRRGAWADPRSPWHGVLFGVIEVTEGTGQVHFGRRTDGSVDMLAITRILGACYAHLAAWLYGVPLGALAPYRPSPEGDAAANPSCERGVMGTMGPMGTMGSVGGEACDVVTIERLAVPTAARALRDPRPLAAPDPLLARAARFVLGATPPTESIEASFPAQPLGLRVRVLSRVRRDPDHGAQKVTTLLITAARADLPAGEAEALRAAQDSALADWLERLAAERAEDN